MPLIKKKIKPFTLVLSGGGARGLAHIGVLKQLEELSYIPSLIVGTSMGAVVGGMYAQLRNAFQVEEKVRSFIESDFFQQIGLEQFSDINDDTTSSIWERFASHLRSRYLISKTMLGTGIFAQETLLKSISILIEETMIEDLSLPFAAVACDLKSGKEIVFTKGSIVNAVTASSAVPGIIAPLNLNNHLLIDGTVTSTIPVLAARSLSKNFIIAVDVRKNLDEFENPQRGFEVVLRSNEITTKILNDLYLRQADLILKPKVSSIKWNEFHTIDHCIQAGENSVKENEQLLSKKLRKTFFTF